MDVNYGQILGYQGMAGQIYHMIQWPTKAGVKYQFEYTSDGNNWLATGDVFPGDNKVQSFTLLVSQPPLRLRVVS